MIPPALTGWPPYTFTPRDFAFESRPFLVDPAPFLCAFCTIKLPRAGNTLMGWGCKVQGRAEGQQPLRPSATFILHAMLDKVQLNETSFALRALASIFVVSVDRLNLSRGRHSF
jgi:hypothetical protein